MQEIMTKAINEANAKIEKAKKEIALIESLPEEVQKMNFFVCSPDRNPFISFEGGSFEELRKLKEYFPALPQVWCDNTHGTREKMEKKCSSEYVVNGKTIKGYEYYEQKGKAFPLASPYIAKFTKIGYPQNGKVTIWWNTGEFCIWYEMNASQYNEVTNMKTSDDVHAIDELRKHGNYKEKPQATTPHLKTGSRIDYWGNSSTCYCKEGQDVEAYEKAIFYGK